MSANFNAQYYWQMRQDQDKIRRRSSREDAYQHMLDSSLWQLAFRNLAARNACSCSSDVLQEAIDEMNTRFDGTNVVPLRGKRGAKN